MPVFEYLSAGTRRALEAYLSGGNRGFREKRVLEFFRMIDWTPPGEPCDLRLLHKLPAPQLKQLGREIEDYRMQKARQRVENSEKREQYRLRVFEYFRIKVPPADKALLESLRDYELDLTGRDVNWRHHFTLDSFKKIDAFIQADTAERMRLFTAFKKDVDTYKKNYDKLHNPHYFQQPCGHAYSFDDWCEQYAETAEGNRQERTRQKPHATAPANPVYQAYRTLQLEWGASSEAVKKQFRRLTLAYHPDLPNGSEERMKAVIAAYQEIQRFWRQSGQMA